MGPFWVEAEHIGRLDQYQLTRLLRILLWLEAGEHELCRSGIRVPLEINVADGGEDGRIEWDGGPESTEFVPKRATLFQCKAQEMGPQECYDELLFDKDQSTKGVKARVSDVLCRGGAYIVFCTQAAVELMYERRIEQMRAALKDGGLTDWEDASIDFLDANKIASWVNKFIGARLYVHECMGRTFPAVLRTWDEWGKHEDLQEPYIETEKTKEYKEQILACCRGEGKGIVRVTGLSGLGKTRLVFEAFGERNDDSSDIEVLRNRVVYASNPGSGNELSSFISECQRWKINDIILVVDDCDSGLHGVLVNERGYCNSGLKLITLDFSPEEKQIDWDTIKLASEDCVGVVRGIIIKKYPGLPTETVGRIEEFAQGFASIAVLLGKQIEEGIDEIGSLSSKKELLEKLLFGREQVDPKVFHAMKICSLFERFRLEPPKGGEDVEFMVQELVKSEKRDFLQTCRIYEERGILQRRGRYVRVCPVPLAITLAAEWFEDPYNDLAQIIKKIEGGGLLEAFCEQAKKLHFCAEARKIVVKVLGPQGPFGNAEALLTEEGSRVFRAFVEVNPQVTVQVLERCLEGYGRKEILEVKNGVRRNLVWALEKLCWWEETFQSAARLMLRLAAAENESWGNNATGIFLGLGHVYLPGTQASLDERLRLFRDALKSESVEEKTLAVKVLGSALRTEAFSRGGGVEKQGSRMPGRDYEPKADEIRKYWEECIESLVNESESGSELADCAAEEFASHIGGLITLGMVEQVERGIEKVVSARGPYWPEALAGIRWVLDYAAEDMPEDVRGQVEAIERLLEPDKLEERLRLIVSVPDWRHRKDEEGGYVDLAAEDARGLAEELGKKTDWYEWLGVVLRGEQRAGYVFGSRLGELIESQVEFVEKSLKVLKEMPCEEGNPTVLGAFLAGTENRELADKTLDRVVGDKDLVRYAISMTTCLEIDENRLRRLMGLIGKEGLSVGDFEVLSFGKALDKVSAGTVMELWNALGEQGTPGLQVGLHILYMYCYNNDERFAECREAFKEMLLRTPEILLGKGGKRCGNMWETVAKRIIHQEGERDTNLAKNLIEGIIEGCRSKSISFSTIEHDVKPVVGVLLQEYFEEVWAPLGERLLGDEWVLVHNLEQVLGSRLKKEDCEAVVAEVPENELITWCKDNTPSAPAIIAKLVPVFKNKEEAKWHPLALRLIDEFGDLEWVRSRLSMNLWSFMSWGSRAPYYDRRIQLLKTVLKHRRAEVRKWAEELIEGFEKEKMQAQQKSEEWEWGIH